MLKKIMSIVMPVIILAFLMGCAQPEMSKQTKQKDDILSANALQKAITAGTVSVVCGDGNSMAITADGSLWVIGNNDYGQLGLGFEDFKTRNTWTKTSLKNVTLVACGTDHSLCVSEGWLYVTGSNHYGQIGLGSTIEHNCQWTRTVYGNIQHIAAGQMHSLFTSGGTLWVAGNNNYGQLGWGGKGNWTTWQQTYYGNIENIACGSKFSLFTSGGNLWVTGDNYYGQLGIGTSGPNAKVLNWTQTGYVGIERIAAGGAHSLFTSGGTLWVTGCNRSGQLGWNGNTDITTWTPTWFGNIENIACGSSHSLFTSGGNLWVTGYNYYGQLGNGTISSGFFDTNSWAPTGDSGIISIAAGSIHSMIVKASGTTGSTWASGDNQYYELGIKRFNGIYGCINDFTQN